MIAKLEKINTYHATLLAFFLDKLRSGPQRSGHDLRLSTVYSAYHAWMLAIDGELAARDSIGERCSPGEDFVGLA